MNTRISLSLLVVAMTVIVASPLSADTKSGAAIVHPVVAVERNRSTTIQRGSALIDVYLALGAPARKLNADTWLYPGFTGGTEESGKDDSRILIVSFKDARVTDLRLVNERAEKVIAALLPPKNPSGTIVATSH